jgi:hypothetical protein
LHHQSEKKEKSIMKRVLVADDCPTCNASGKGAWEITTPQGTTHVCPDCLGTGNQETWIPWDVFVAMVKYGEEPPVVTPETMTETVRDYDREAHKVIETQRTIHTRAPRVP